MPRGRDQPQGFQPRPAQSLIEVQLVLARLGFCPGSLDGTYGSRTRNALRAFQQREGLTMTGQPDEATRARLLLREVPYTQYVVTGADLDRLLPLGASVLARSRQPRLDYETLLELVAEKARSHPELIRRLNPTVDWTNVVAGVSLLVPNVSSPKPSAKAAFVRIQLSARTLQVWDGRPSVLAQFPCSIGRRVDSRPVGELHVVGVAADPNYTFDPEDHPNLPEARQLKSKVILPPGPNNPVGTAWIGLNRPGYGIHGTPRPEQVGQAESNGCFRLANWNAESLLQFVWIGMPVYVEL
jgi:hypothetical protein